MCQLNVDAYQGEMNRFCHTNYRIPIVFFTQVLGLAFGLEPGSLGFGSEMVSTRQALLKIGASPPEPVEPQAGRKHRPKPEGLPMPRMPERQEVGS
jgi:heterodisulfide reductase subunit B